MSFQGTAKRHIRDNFGNSGNRASSTTRQPQRRLVNIGGAPRAVLDNGLLHYVRVHQIFHKLASSLKARGVDRLGALEGMTQAQLFEPTELDFSGRRQFEDLLKRDGLVFRNLGF